MPNRIGNITTDKLAESIAQGLGDADSLGSADKTTAKEKIKEKLDEAV